MFNQDSPEGRRGLRNVLEGVALLALLWFVWTIIHKLGSDAPSLSEIARYSLGIIALGVFLDKSENVTRAIKLKLGKDGLDGEIGEDDTKPVA